MTRALVLFVALAQAAAMAVDEGHFHRARGLPRWERIGHPLDTLSVMAAYGWLSVTKPSEPNALGVYVALAVFSCLFVTKDEVIHRHVCSPAECWLHAILFILHPIVLATFGWAWLHGDVLLVHVQLALTAAFGAYQLIYWNFVRQVRRTIS